MAKIIMGNDMTVPQVGSEMGVKIFYDSRIHN